MHRRDLWRRAALSLLGACSSAPAGPKTQVVVGIQGGRLNGEVGTLHVTTTLGAEPATDATLAPSALPYSVPLAPPNGNLGAAVAVRVEGYTQSGWTRQSGGLPILVRTAETHFVAGESPLLRVTLQAHCLLGLPGGALGAPTCPIPQTCVDGQCVDDSVPAGSLERYTAQWASEFKDPCDPPDAGPPQVQVGMGQSDFVPATDGQSVYVERGPQSGHHIWIAIRQQNLTQEGSTTTITSVQPGTGLVGPKLSYGFAFVPDAGGFCKLFALRYQLDIDGNDLHLFLGQPLDVTVTVKDARGATASGTAHLDISAEPLCPSGVPGCPDSLAVQGLRHGLRKPPIEAY